MGQQPLQDQLTQRKQMQWKKKKKKKGHWETCLTDGLLIKWLGDFHRLTVCVGECVSVQLEELVVSAYW